MTGIRITDEAVEKALDWIKTNGPKFAADRASRIHMEKWVKVVWAEEFQKAEGKTVADREAAAESSEAYKQALGDYRVCIEADEYNRQMSDAASLQIEIWRTESANQRRSGF